MRSAKGVVVGFVAALALTAPSAHAVDPTPGRIVAPGSASADVAPDSVSIDFQLEITSDTFQQGAAKVRAVVADLAAIPPPAEGVKISATHDLMLMQQKKWTSGTKQQQKVRVTVDGVPEGQAEKVTIAVVEAATKKSPDLTVIAYEARLSDARARQAQNVLLKEAIANSREFAATAATAGNLTFRAVHSIHIGGPSDPRSYELTEMVTVQSDSYYPFARSKAFVVRDQLAATIHVSVSVVVEYDCAPK